MASPTEVKRIQEGKVRWPRALSILMEHGKTIHGADVYTLVCNGAYCFCGWRGPLRDNAREAEQDRARHLDAPGEFHELLAKEGRIK